MGAHVPVPVRMGNAPIAVEAVGGETAWLGMGAGLRTLRVYRKPHVYGVAG